MYDTSCQKTSSSLSIAAVSYLGLFDGNISILYSHKKDINKPLNNTQGSKHPLRNINTQ